MKPISIQVSTIALYAAINSCYALTNTDAELTGSFFGQAPPGTTAKIFAPDVVSIKGQHEYGIAFSPDLTELYYSTQKPNQAAQIYFSTMRNNSWQGVKKLSLTGGQKAGEMHPFISHDNKSIYFTAYNSDYTDTKIWSALRSDNGWGEAGKLNSPINEREVFYSSIANNGDLYYTDIFKSQTFRASLARGEYGQAHAVNIEFGLHPFISPKQDYLLVDAVATDQGRKDKDIYVYFKTPDGGWSKPVNLGIGVNSSFYETVPSVTPDGKYLFFSRYVEDNQIADLYWVSTQVIESLRPKE